MKKNVFRTVRYTVIATLAAFAVISAFPVRAHASELLGQQRRWTLEFRTWLEQPAQGPPVEVALSGDWTSTIVAVRPGEYDAALELANARITGGGIGKPSAEAIEQAQRRLSRPFWVTYRNDGTLLAIHFFKDVDPSDRNLLQMVATGAQFVRPDATKMVWNALERDGAGSYLAIYNWTEPNAVVKRKLKYVHTDAEPGAPADGLHLDVQQSELRFSLDSNGEINTLEGSERVRIGGSRREDGQLVAVTVTRLTNFHRGNAPELIGSLLRAGADVVNSPILTHRSDPEKLRAHLDDQLLEGHTTESLLEAALAKKSDDQHLSERLTALFRRRSESIPTALALLRKSGPERRITYALGAAHTPAAIKALSSLALDQASLTPVRIDALAALVLVQHPSLEAMRIPVALLDNSDPQIASAARIMGGTVARAGRKEHLADADAIDAALIARYRDTRDAGQLSDLLAALGNSVGPAVLPVIEEALHNPRDPVRAAAARALRLAEAPEIDGLLSAAITTDGEPHVRAAAIFATTFRRPTILLAEALIQAAKTDSADYVRSDAIVQLRAHPQSSPAIPETLAWIAEHDAKPGIRRLAREGLSRTEQPQDQVSKPQPEALE